MALIPEDTRDKYFWLAWALGASFWIEWVDCRSARSVAGQQQRRGVMVLSLVAAGGVLIHANSAS